MVCRLACTSIVRIKKRIYFVAEPHVIVVVIIHTPPQTFLRFAYLHLFNSNEKRGIK